MNMNKKLFITTKELSDILGLSRVSIFKKIKSGEIKAVKKGRNYFIAKKELPTILGDVISEKDKKEINSAVDKVIEEYKTTLELLSKE